MRSIDGGFFLPAGVIQSMPMRALMFKLMLQLTRGMGLKRIASLSRILGGLMWRFSARHRGITLTNVRLCYPQLKPGQQEKLARMAMNEAVTSMLELGRLWLHYGSNVEQIIRDVHGLHHLKTAIAQNKGVLMAVPHLGNWEALGLYLARFNGVNFLYKPPKEPAIERLLLKYRQNWGLKLIPGNHKGVKTLLQALKRNEIVGILPDQLPKSGNGVFAPFFGHPAYTMTLFSRLANKSRAPVVFATARRLPQGQGFDVHFMPGPGAVVGDLADSAAAINRSIETLIQLAPAQYQWTYKRFSIQPDQSNPYRR